MKKEYIEFKAEVWGKTVLFQILDMPERFRQNLRLETPKYWVCSSLFPAFNEDRVNLWGADKRQDDHVVAVEFESRAKAASVLLNLISSIKYFADKNDSKARTNKSGIYKFEIK
jgi:hypothetical protein